MNPNDSEQEPNTDRQALEHFLALPESNREAWIAEAIQRQDPSLIAIIRATVTEAEKFSPIFRLFASLKEEWLEHREEIVQDLLQGEYTFDPSLDWMAEYSAVEEAFLAKAATELDADVDYLADTFTVTDLVVRVKAFRAMRASIVTPPAESDAYVTKIQRIIMPRRGRHGRRVLTSEEIEVIHRRVREFHRLRKKDYSINAAARRAHCDSRTYYDHCLAATGERPIRD